MIELPEVTHLIHRFIPGQAALRAGARPVQACNPLAPYRGYAGPNADICPKCEAAVERQRWGLPDLW